jgi:NADH dehydrogenase
MAIKILVLGGGFAGINAVRHLAAYQRQYDLDIKLISKHRWSLFSPLLPDLISGRINPEHITYELEPFCRKHNTQFIHAAIQSIDPEKKIVQTQKGDFNADFILISIGCENNYHGHNEFVHKIPGLKSLHEGILIRNLTKQVLDNTSNNPAVRANILIVGAGYTGFEVASHIALYASQYCGYELSELSKIANILMVEYDNKILATTSPGVQKWAEKFITNYDVGIRTEVTIKEVIDSKAILTDGSVFEDAFVVWTAGVAPGMVCRNMNVKKEKTGRFDVDEYLRLQGFSDIFAAGDVAGAIPKGHDQPLRMGVQFSLSGGFTAAQNIIKTISKESLVEYAPVDPGYVIPLGPGHAISVILNHEMHGRLPFFLHYFMSAYRSWGWKNKFAILKDLFSEVWPWPSKTENHRRIDKKHDLFCGKNPDPNHVHNK